ncbi:hypothetical protein IWQ51_006718 [Labrenzia sp. EL_142]|nr:hypothetical protein [Labrenzia sp. EL_142]
MTLEHSPNCASAQAPRSRAAPGANVQPGADYGGNHPNFRDIQNWTSGFVFQFHSRRNIVDGQVGPLTIAVGTSV